MAFKVSAKALAAGDVAITVKPDPESRAQVPSAPANALGSQASIKKKATAKDIVEAVKGPSRSPTLLPHFGGMAFGHTTFIAVSSAIPYPAVTLNGAFPLTPPAAHTIVPEPLMQPKGVFNSVQPENQRKRKFQEDPSTSAAEWRGCKFKKLKKQ
ncbi:hypothetical protein WJX73_004501 [Symbiochloris irregularis]|uniref:Uncharacterized protein n=1 Tax=Symbiochloris irregularis TaxID=706552 RepID=A0AAW1NZU5_9CHLO